MRYYFVRMRRLRVLRTNLIGILDAVVEIGKFVKELLSLGTFVSRERVEIRL